MPFTLICGRHGRKVSQGIDRPRRQNDSSINQTNHLISLTLHVTLLTSNGGGRRQREMTDTFYSLFTRVAFLSSFLLVLILNRLR